MRPALGAGDGPLIGITDPSGALGSRVARRLARAGARQRLVALPDAEVPVLPGAEVVRVDHTDAAAVRRALDGVEDVLVVPLRESADRVERHRAVVDAAVDAGVGRIVYWSFLGASATSTFTFARDHHATEEHIRATGLPATVVRGSAFLEVLRWIIGPDGVIRGPAGDGVVAPVGRDDCAEAVAAVLTGGGHDGATLELTGPELLSLHDVAAAFSRAGGRPVTYEDEPVEAAWAARRALGAPEWQVAGWVTTYTQLAAGDLAVVTDTVRWLTGRPALSLHAYLAAHPEDARPMA